MRAIILAAGVGSRLFGDDRSQPPKCLIEFDGKSLLRRHVEHLLEVGIDSLALVVGYRPEAVAAEALRHAPDGYVQALFNPMYRGGPVISLWTAREVLRGGDEVLFMDADVLYDPEILRRLLASEHANAFAYDGALDEGEDPVRICLRDGWPVDFGKRVTGHFDAVGEWPGFMRLSPELGGLLADALERHIDAGALMAPYEDAVRDVLVGEAPGTFGIVDVSDLSWIEIDFPRDLERARTVILPGLPAPRPGARVR